jgi:hypothetical protein
MSQHAEQDQHAEWDRHEIEYAIKTNKPLTLEVKRAELVADMVDHIVNIFDSHKLVPYRRTARETANMLIGNMVFSMGANLPDMVDDGMFFSRELIEAIPDSYVPNYMRCMRKAEALALANAELTVASVLTEAELKALAVKCDVKNMMLSALDELKICAKHINAMRVYVLPRKIESGESGGSVCFRIGKITTEKISADVYNRLVLAFNKTAFNEGHAKTAAAAADANIGIGIIDAAICSLILRYSTLGSMGHQFGIPRNIKDAFRDRLGANFELMASALNSHYDNYCSLFYDIEKMFGSSGPINHMSPISGVFIANPPYEPEIIETMVDLMLKALATAEKDGKYLVFLFGLPDWHDDPPLPFYTKFGTSKYKMCDIEFQGVWENLTNGVLMPLKMTSHRCMLGWCPVGARADPAPIKNIFTGIIREWKAMRISVPSRRRNG